MAIKNENKLACAMQKPNAQIPVAASTDARAKSVSGMAGARAYLLATLCVGVAFALRMEFDPLWGNRLPYVWFFLAVLAVTRFAGLGPQILTFLVGLLLGDWFFVPPRHSLLIADRVDQINAGIYVAVGSLVLFCAAMARRAAARELASRARLAAIVESSDDAMIGASVEGSIASWNAAAERLYGYVSTEAIGRSFAMLFPVEGNQEFSAVLDRVRNGERVSHFETKQRTQGNGLVDVSLTISPVQTRDTQIVGISITVRDVSERKRKEVEREQLIKQLRDALAEVKTLTGLLPICSHCKNIRDAKGSWNAIEKYIRDRSNADFTHGICPDCIRQLYPRLGR